MSGEAAIMREEKTELVQQDRTQNSSMFPDINNRSGMQQTASINAETPDIEAGKGSK